MKNMLSEKLGKFSILGAIQRKKELLSIGYFSVKTVPLFDVFMEGGELHLLLLLHLLDPLSKRLSLEDFPDGPVVKILHYQCRGYRFNL